MTRGEKLIRSWPLKRSFYDAHERRAYLRAIEIATRIVDDPSLIQRGADHFDRFMRGDPHQRAASELWRSLLRKSAEVIAEALLADTERGATLRETAPVFVVIPEWRVRQIWRSPA